MLHKCIYGPSTRYTYGYATIQKFYKNSGTNMSHTHIYIHKFYIYKKKKTKFYMVNKGT